jgi:hypothetical protein
MNESSIYIGFNVHWGLNSLRKELGTHIIAQTFAGHDRPRSGSLLDRLSTSAAGKLLNDAMRKVFNEIGKTGIIITQS